MTATPPVPLVLTISAPATAAVTQNTATPINGLALSATGDQPGEVFRVNLTDNTGQLTASGTGVTGAGTPCWRSPARWRS